VLGSLGRARLVPIAFSGSNLGFRHSTPTKAKILAHSLEVSKKKVTSVSDIPPLKLPTCGLYKIKKTSSFYLHPGGLNILQAPSLLGWTPAQPMTSSASMLLRTLWRWPRCWRTPPPEGPESALLSPVVPPQVLPVWPVGCPSPDVLRPPHGFAVVSLKNGSATPPAVFQTNERWVSLLLHFSMTSTDGLGFSK